ncbi:MAG: hypothetical protein LBG57_10355 [Treponema sp.]|jgi:hypothetical protein|nr:hypothetical protein [Treponema sp.]
MLKKLLCVFVSCVSLPLFAEIRSFDAIFPGLPAGIRETVFSDAGYFGSSVDASGLSVTGGAAAAGLDPRISAAVLDKKPAFFIESLLVIPQTPDTVTLPDIYNALGNVRKLKGRLYFSETRGKQIPLFEDATRLESAKKNTPVPDPRPASAVPRTETVFIRLRDVNFGNSYYRGDMTVDNYGIRYLLSNYKNLTYLFVPVIREEQFTAQLYFEPIAEGVLIYGLAGADVSDFVASKIDIPSAISKRLAVIISWVAEGIGKTGRQP